jgi:hypothetical protein
MTRFISQLLNGYDVHRGTAESHAERCEHLTADKYSAETSRYFIFFDRAERSGRSGIFRATAFLPPQRREV